MRNGGEQSADQQLHGRHGRQTSQRSKQSEGTQTTHILHRGQLVQEGGHHHGEVEPVPGISQIALIAQNEAHGQDFGNTLAQENVHEEGLQRFYKDVDRCHIFFVSVVFDSQKERIYQNQRNNEVLEPFAGYEPNQEYPDPVLIIKHTQASLCEPHLLTMHKKGTVVLNQVYFVFIFSHIPPPPGQLLAVIFVNFAIDP